MGVRYEQSDENQIIFNIYIEAPWTWEEYNKAGGEVFSIVRDLQHPCATVVNVSKMGSVPKDGRTLSNLIGMEKQMPDNLFASVIVGTNYVASIFMNVLMKVRPSSSSRRMVLFTQTMEEAHEKIYTRYQEITSEPIDR